jgi:hypothetical protein
VGSLAESGKRSEEKPKQMLQTLVLVNTVEGMKA